MKQSKPIPYSAAQERPRGLQGPSSTHVPMLAVAVAVLCLSAYARPRTVSTMAELTEAIREAKPGDRLVLLNGSYDGALDIDCSGTIHRPVWIQSSPAGAAVFRDRIRLRGPHVIVTGLRFEDGGHVLIEASHVRLSRCTFDNCTPKTWLRIDPPQCNVEIDHCLFANKTNNRMYDLRPSGNHGARPTLLIRVSDRPGAPADRHHIHHNYFRDIRPGSVPDGYEAVVLTTGDSRSPHGSARILMEYNLFERCAGEAEIVSVRCNDNVIRHNAFINCRGSLSFAAGHGNIACGNYFDGMHNGGGCGVRVHGGAHQITNNHFRRLRWGIALLDNAAERADRHATAKPACGENGGPALIVANTFERCEWSIRTVGLRTTSADGAAPSTSPVWLIANNTFHSTATWHGAYADDRRAWMAHWVGDSSAGCCSARSTPAATQGMGHGSILPGTDPRTDRIVGSCALLPDYPSSQATGEHEQAFEAVSLPIVMPLSDEDVGPLGFLVASPPLIESQPRDLVVQDGDDAAFHVAASGWPLFFQWYCDGERLDDETEPTLTLEDVSSYDDGSRFHVMVENENGIVSSDTVMLTVVPFANVYVADKDDAPRTPTGIQPMGPAAGADSHEPGDCAPLKQPAPSRTEGMPRSLE